MSPLLPPTLAQALPRALNQARQPVPAGLHRFMLDDLALGWVHPMRVPLLRTHWPALAIGDGTVRWAAGGWDVAARSAQLAQVAEALRAAGAITGWRDERYACERPWPDAAAGDPPAARGETLFEMERSAFRFFGLMSRAVHINGFLPGGRLVCGRRALTKATDPGKLDNLAAGGLTAGEDLRDCARRELWEEAGVPMAISEALTLQGQLRSTRMTPEGWHDEVLHIFSLRLPLGFAPLNRDGEVSEFSVLDLESLGERLRYGDFSIDAAAVTAWALMQPRALDDLRA